MGCPGESDDKESACNVGDLGLMPGSERSPGERNGYPLQYSCLENSVDRGAWWAAFCGITKNWTQYVPRFIIHSSVDGHVSCFHVLAIVNSAAVAIVVV